MKFFKGSSILSVEYIYLFTKALMDLRPPFRLKGPAQEIIFRSSEDKFITCQSDFFAFKIFKPLIKIALRLLGTVSICHPFESRR